MAGASRSGTARGTTCAPAVTAARAAIPPCPAGQDPAARTWPPAAQPASLRGHAPHKNHDLPVSGCWVGGCWGPRAKWRRRASLVLDPASDRSAWDSPGGPTGSEAPAELQAGFSGCAPQQFRSRLGWGGALHPQAAINTGAAGRQRGAKRHRQIWSAGGCVGGAGCNPPPCHCTQHGGQVHMGLCRSMPGSTCASRCPAAREQGWQWLPPVTEGK